MFFVCFENDHHPFYEERGTPIMSKRGGLLGTAKEGEVFISIDFWKYHFIFSIVYE